MKYVINFYIAPTGKSFYSLWDSINLCEIGRFPTREAAQAAIP